MEIRGFKDTIEWYDNNADAYAKNAMQVSHAKSVEEFLTFLPPSPRVLEAGCAVGREARVFKDRGADVVGIDISEGLLAVAREMHPDIEFIHADFRTLPFPDTSFDGVWAHASLVHLETLEEVRESLAEFNRVLKPGGYLYVCVKRQQGECKTEIVSDSLSKHDRFFRYYQEQELAALLQEAGFEEHTFEIDEDPHARKEVTWLRTIVRKIS